MSLHVVVPLAVSLALAMGLLGCGNGSSGGGPTPSPTPPPTPPPTHPGLLYIGGRCNVLTADGCNPNQMPLLNDGEVFNPNRLLHARPDEVLIDHTEITDDSYTIDFGENTASISSQTANGFGIGGKVPYNGITFSGGTKFQRIATNMNEYDELNYYGEVYRKYIVETATLSHDAKANMTKELEEAMAALPQSPSTDEEYQAWFEFFNRFGTHYVQSVEFGGEMRLDVFLHSETLKQEGISKSDWNFNLGATFDQLAHIKVNWNGSHSEDTWSKFSSAQFQQHFHIVGGDQTVGDYAKWLSTVKDKPAPIITTLASIEDLMPQSVEYLSILRKYFDACPHTDNLGVCGGYGICDFKAKSCECDVVAYKDTTDGNCYPKCANDCNGHGVCNKGRCKCDLDSKYNTFGWYTPEGQDPCSAACGQKVFDAGDEDCHCAPGTDCDLLGVTDDAQTCWCQSQTGLHESQMKGSGSTAPCDRATYKCSNDDQVCHCDFCPLTGHCPCYQAITCTHGTKPDCPGTSNANSVDFGGVETKPGRRNQTRTRTGIPQVV